MSWVETPPFRPNVIVETIGPDWQNNRRRDCSGTDEDALALIDAILASPCLGCLGFMVRAEPANVTRRFRLVDDVFVPCSKEELHEIRRCAAFSFAEQREGDENAWGDDSYYQRVRERWTKAADHLETVFASIWGPRLYWRDKRKLEAQARAEAEGRKLVAGPCEIPEWA